MAQIDEIIAEADQYTDYCRLLDYQTAKAEEYVEKAAQQVSSSAGLVTAQFPYGVGPTIMAAKAAVAQNISAGEEIAEGVAAAVVIVDKLDELEIPEEGCN